MVEKREEKVTENEEYLKNGKLPRVLTKEEEEQYLYKYFVEKDEASREKLIVHNLRLISYVLRKEFPDLNQKEVFSHGVEAIVVALDHYKYNQNVGSLSTFLYASIKMEYGKYVTSQNWAKRRGTLLPLEETVYCGNKKVVLKYSQFEDRIIDKLWTQEKVKKVYSIVSKMKDRWQRIFAMYYLSSERQYRLQEIAEQEGITHQRVHQILQEITRRIKIEMALLEREEKQSQTI